MGAARRRFEGLRNGWSIKGAHYTLAPKASAAYCAWSGWVMPLAVGWAKERSDVPNGMHDNVGHATLCPTYQLIFVARNVIAMAALEHYSLTTMLFPAATAIACFAFVLMVAYRRQVLAVR